MARALIGRELPLLHADRVRLHSKQTGICSLTVVAAAGGEASAFGVTATRYAFEVERISNVFNRGKSASTTATAAKPAAALNTTLAPWAAGVPPVGFSELRPRGRFTEVDLAALDAKERMRSAPVLELPLFTTLWDKAAANAEAALLEDDEEAGLTYA